MGSEFTTAAAFRWKGIGSILQASEIDYFCKTEKDMESVDKMSELLNKKHCPDASFLYLEDPDEYGHLYGFDYNSSEYIDAIQTADKVVGEMLSIISEREEKYKERWCVMITTDHGGVKKERLTEELGETFEKFEAKTNTPHPDHYLGVHGLDIPQMRTVFVIYKETGMKNGVELIPGPRSVDVAASALDFFGLQDHKSDGHPISRQA